MRGYIRMNKRQFTAETFDPVIAEEAAKVTYFTRYYISVGDDALLLRTNPNDEKVFQRIHFAAMDNIGVVTTENILYFVTFLLKIRHSTKSSSYSRLSQRIQ